MKANLRVFQEKKKYLPMDFSALVEAKKDSLYIVGYFLYNISFNTKISSFCGGET